MFRSHLRIAAALLIAGLCLGCEKIENPAETTRKQISTTATNVRKNLKKIQLHGEVDIEVMTQITAVNEAYQQTLELKRKPPMSWSDLEANARQAGTVQEARRQNAYVRFGVTAEQMADEVQKSETLIAIKSTNDSSIWAMKFGGDIEPIDESAFDALARQQ